MKNFTAHNTYTNTADDGRFGRNFEVDLRAYLTALLTRMHPMNTTDVVVKRGVTLECKTGCGWLVNPWTDDILEADDVLANGFKMRRATYVAYVPQYDENTCLADVRFLTQAQFLTIFADAGKVRVKRGSNGQYGIAIQSYIPTPTFKASKAKYQAILDRLNDGLTAEEFVEKFAL